MTLNLTVPKQQYNDFVTRITVIGVGGGGSNAVDNMITSNLRGVEFVVANTDAQQLASSKAECRIQLGPHLTQGLGAGAKPEIGRAAAEEAADELARYLDGVNMLFITAGMGGGTGTGAAPVIARMARERGILTVGVVTKPFNFEGRKRTQSADHGVAELQQYVDTLIVIPNQNLFRLASPSTTWQDAFKMADEVLYTAVRGVADLIVTNSLVNLDFNDVRTVMVEMGKATMGTGEAEGEGRAMRAAEEAISNPLLEDNSLAGARGLLVFVTGGPDMTLYEVDEAVNRISREVADEANIIFGSAVDENLTGRIRVSVVATGIDSVPAQAEAQQQRPRLVVNGPAEPVAAVAKAAPVQPVTAAPLTAEPATLRQPLRAPAAEPAAAPETTPLRANMPPVPPPPATRVGSMYATPAPAPVAPPAGKSGLFGLVTGRRTVAEAAAPVAQPRASEPRFTQAAPAPSIDPLDVEMPAFLRRQSS